MLGQAATMRTIDGVREALLDELRSRDTLEVDCAAVEDVDLTFLQVLTAAARQAATEGKSFRILPNASPALVRLADRAGLPLGDLQATAGGRS